MGKSKELSLEEDPNFTIRWEETGLDSQEQDGQELPVHRPAMNWKLLEHQW